VSCLYVPIVFSADARRAKDRDDLEHEHTGRYTVVYFSVAPVLRSLKVIGNLININSK